MISCHGHGRCRQDLLQCCDLLLLVLCQPVRCLRLAPGGCVSSTVYSKDFGDYSIPLRRISDRYEALQSDDKRRNQKEKEIEPANGLVGISYAGVIAVYRNYRFQYCPGLAERSQGHHLGIITTAIFSKTISSASDHSSSLEWRNQPSFRARTALTP